MVGTRNRKGTRTLSRPTQPKRKTVLRRTRPALPGLVLVVLLAVALLAVAVGLLGRLPGFGPYALYVDDIAIQPAHAFAGRYDVFIRPLTEAAGIYTNWDAATGKVSIGGQPVRTRLVDGEAATDLAPLARRLKMRFTVNHWRRQIRVYSGRALLPVVPAGRVARVFLDGAVLTEKAIEAGDDVLVSLKVATLALGASSGRGPGGEVLFEGKPIAGYNRAGVIYIPAGEACARKGVRFSPLGLDRYYMNSGAPVLTPGDERPPTAIKKVATADKVVALTFDDELVPETAKLLDILEEKKVPATFFVTGRSIAWQPAIATRIVAGGSEIGNHTYDHTHLNEISDIDEVRAEILGTRRAVYAATGTATELFRPPGGILTRDGEKAIAGSGQKLILWTVSVGDYLPRKKAADIVKGVVRGASPGGIILLHNAPPATIEALPAIIDQLKANGYRFLTLSELLGLPTNQGGGGTR